MKHRLPKLLLLGAVALTSAARADINVPGDGSDGVFMPLSNVVINLDQATTGVWDQNNTTNAGVGVYDPDKWAVVFKFQSVIIPANVRVTFQNHRSRAPVVWLVQSNVTIAGTVSLDGENGDAVSALNNVNKQGGPGGFRGGLGTISGTLDGSVKNGLGPSDTYYSSSYGNAAILPLMGGPGSSFRMWYTPSRRSGGGGAILIASRTAVQVDGQITAKGGDDGAYNSNVGSNPGNSGAIKLICDEIRGAGSFDAPNGGRIRIEANFQRLTNPSFADWLAPKPGDPPVIWPGPDAPKARIVSIGAITGPATNAAYAIMPTPTEPLAPLNGNPDLLIQTSSAVDIFVETQNFPVEGVVNVRVIPKYTDAWWTGASLVSGNYSKALWKATATLGATYTTLQVRAYVP